MVVCWVDGRSRFTRPRVRLERAHEISLSNSRVSLDQLNKMLKCQKNVLTAASRHIQAPNLVPGTGSKVEVVGVRAELLAVDLSIDAVSHSLQLFLRNLISNTVEEGPLRKAGWARLRMPDEVALVGRFAGVALPWKRLAHT